MKLILVFSLLMLNIKVFGQQIEVPKGIVYKYCDSLKNEKAKSIITKELSDSASYSLDNGLTFIGPVLWSRYKTVEVLKAIKKGDVTIKGYKSETSSGKITQTKEDFKLVWDYLRGEVKNSNFKLRKATVPELKYYWSVISFDIEEPLIIIETTTHNYILNLSPEDYRIVWLDEAPKQ